MRKHQALALFVALQVTYTRETRKSPQFRGCHAEQHSRPAFVHQTLFVPIHASVFP
ncbi:MAG TPA: hypothetical protein VKE24_09115 [Candidatus Acidoferrales bacterium]|nr:hypothetical protein [Candidatus Acidoferrales bacterium]